MSLLLKLLVSFCSGDGGVGFPVPASSCFCSTSSYNRADIFGSQCPLSILRSAFAYSITCLPVDTVHLPQACQESHLWSLSSNGLQWFLFILKLKIQVASTTHSTLQILWTAKHFCTDLSSSLLYTSYKGNIQLHYTSIHWEAASVSTTSPPNCA